MKWSINYNGGGGGAKFQWNYADQFTEAPVQQGVWGNPRNNENFKVLSCGFFG
jgi:hypothetical protein